MNFFETKKYLFLVPVLIFFYIVVKFENSPLKNFFIKSSCYEIWKLVDFTLEFTQVRL